MKRLFLKTIAIALFLLVIPASLNAQYPRFSQNGTTLEFDITEISNFDQRIVFLYNLVNDGRFNVASSEEDGFFTVCLNPSIENRNLQEAFEGFKAQHTQLFSRLDKENLSEMAIEYKSLLSQEFIHSLMMDIYIQSRQNNLCALADPFCTDNGLYQFPAGVNAGSGEPGPNYACLSTTPNPAWYYMRIGNPGGINIYMYSTPSVDIDFCCWGPFEDPVSPCPNGLTIQKKVSCSYSPNPTETCVIPNNAQTGQYYILVITNFSNQTCNISFSKTSGYGTTDCGIMPPLVDNDGPFCMGDPIHLTANGQDGATYHWSGPNNYSSNQQNPTINNCNLSHAGTYTCTISLNGQTNSASTDVVVYAQPNANFNATSVCVGNPTSFTNASTSNPSNQSMSFHWNFGDGQSSIETNPVHQYATAGSYSVTLTASCGDGQCTSTKTKTVTVYNQPVAHASAPQSVEYGQKATLTGSGGGNGNFNYHWEPENLVENPNAQTTLTHELTALQNTFTLTVTNPDNNECVSTDEVTILVEGSNLTATANALPNVICLGDTTQLQAIAVGGTPNRTYLWEPAGSLISAPNTANPKACPTETTTYNCTIEDGLTTVNVSVTVTVNYPEYEEMDRYICPDGEYPFYDQTCTAEGDYEYHTTTAQGCEKIITLHLHHYPSYPNAHTTEAYICPGDYYPFQGSNYYAQGLHPVTLSTIHGCDSVVWLDLKVYPANDTIVEERDICVSDTLIWYGNAYFTDGDEAYFDDMDVNGCLLVRKLHLRVGQYQSPPGDYNPNVYQCVAHDEEPHYRWEIAGRDYYTDTRDTIIIPNPNPQKCDYLYTLNLKFHKETLVTDTVTVCDEYKWDVTGATFTSTNHHIEHDVDIPFGPNNTCRDTTYVLDLTVNHSSRSTIDTTACNEFHWDFGWNHEADTTITEIGSHSFERMIRTTHGCDSIVTMNVQLDKSPVFNKINGNTWVVGGSEFQFTVETYTINTTGTHETSWRLTYKNGDPFTKWDLVDFTDGCLVYIYTFELDTIYLHATTKSVGQGSEICGNQPNTKDKMIICTAYGTPEITRDCHVDIYPNPNDGNMTLSFTNMSGEILVKVFNMRGTQIDQFQVYNGYESRTYSYNSSRLTPGIYLFSIASREGTLIKKVVVM